MSKKLKVFTCNDHKGTWPVGAASVVVAKSKSEARMLLNAELERRGLEITHFTLVKLLLNKPSVRVLLSGEY